MYTPEQAKARRDRKVRGALKDIAPIWLINDEYRPLEESCLFDLIYQHSIYGWVQHRFKYDAFNDVLYHMGEKRLNEADVLYLDDQEPYIAAGVATVVPNNPQGRPSLPP